jgi:thioesterase domain-containing protein
MARQLQEQGQEVAMLALIDAGVPHPQETEHNWAVLLSIFAYDLGLTGEKYKRPPSFTPRPQMVELRELWVAAKREGVVPSVMTLVEFRNLFDLFKIYANTLRRYSPGQFRGKITLFSPGENYEHLIFSADNTPEDQRRDRLDPSKGWGSLATEGVEVHHLPGNHFSMLHEPNVQVLGERIRQCVEEVRSRRNGSGR